DSEVKKVIDSAFARAVETLNTHLELLHVVAKMLLERETLTREDFDILRRGEALPPRAPLPPSTLKPAVPPPIPIATSKPALPPLLGGPEVSPA
ncbi:MAG: cell division protein FtsH, partial [Gemmatimonadaceae bacterium]